MSADDDVKALRADRARLRRVLDVASDAYLCSDAATGRLVDCNAVAETLFGWSRAELLGADGLELLSPAHLREQHRDLRAQVLAVDQGGQRAPMRAEATLQRRDGSPVQVEALVWVSDSDDGRRLLQVLCRDVTE